ncbi:MAG: hypothetical protein HY551_00810 [Elusimicrobia bacterium]|nr:hypothetical protein [Elusimicrobiota bacterium]
MMRDHGVHPVGGYEPASIVEIDAVPSFLFARQRVIRLAPLDSSAHAGYVWRKIFLKDRRIP